MMSDRRPLEAVEAGPAGDGAVDHGARELDDRQQTIDDTIDIYAEPHVIFPGEGSKPADCGDYKPLEFCNVCGEVNMVKRCCNRRICPDCWKIWTAKSAETGVNRIMKYRWAQDPGIGRRVVHAVFSPDPGEVRTLGDLDTYRRKAIEKAKECGIRGGSIVQHTHRVKDSVQAEIPGDEAQQWEYVRENDRPMREQVEWAPHWHVIGPCRDFEPSDDSWTCERLSTMDRMDSLTDREAYESVAGCFRYILSHATFEEDAGKPAVTWFGDLASGSSVSLDDGVSDGASEVIERLASEVVGEDDERETTCSDEDCDGDMESIARAGWYLERPGWCDKITDENERRLLAAREWVRGVVKPPPGMKHPRNTAQGDEALDHIVETQY